MSGRLLTRTVAHLSVVGLVAFSVVVGVAFDSPQRARQAAQPVGFRLISAVHAAVRTADAPTSPTSYELAPEPNRPTQETGPDRMPPRAAPSPAPTPAPVDPEATPLPAPPAQGAVEGSAGSAEAQPQPPPAPPPPSPTLVWPVPGGQISQPFHAGHLALDIAASPGSAVVASEGGLVTSAGWRDNGGGLVISIDHGNGITTVYNHLGSIWVWTGQYVARGEGIGGVGCTGICTGPHVHYEVIVGGVLVNPLRYL